MNPNKVSSIAQAIDEVINNSELREIFALNARNRALDFSKVDIPYDEVKWWKTIRSPGSATIVNAIATGYGSAFGIDLDINCIAKTKNNSITCLNDVGADTF